MKITTAKLILFTAIFLVVFDNYSFFNNLVVVYPVNTENLPFLISLVIVLISLIVFLFTIVSSKYTTKPILILFVIVSAFTNYFMNTYSIIIDDTMIQNMLNTDLNESLDLFSLKLVAYALLLGVLPAYLIYKADIQYGSFKDEIISKVKVIVISLGLIAIIIFSLSQFYTSFFREHKPLRLYTNPIFYIYSSFKYVNGFINSGPIEVKEIALDAKVDKKSNTKRVVVLVVGEAVRADRFSLNGYGRETNKLVSKEDIINFPNVSSCGTTTAVSVPCMFSVYDRNQYSYKKGESTQNVMDILNRTGINTLWRDNNSNWEDVARGSTYENFKSSQNNKPCDGECRDMGMLDGLQEYVDKQDGDIFIVLHQMGNHGPAYYKRYPKEFEKFTPVCKTNQLEKCTPESIGNAYDNTLLYTDYFLSKVIEFLKENKDLETAMIYMSDHGESLGENGLYLHGLPYFMAPETQKHVASFGWFSPEFKKNLDIEKVKKNANEQYSQDNLFHTILGIMDVKTKIYKKDMDIFKD